MPARNGSSWKKGERDIAGVFNTTRVLRQGTNAPDVRIPGWSLEIKKRKTFPDWLIGFFRQARANAIEGDKPAVVLLHARGRGHKIERFVMLEFDDFVEIVAAESGRGPAYIEERIMAADEKIDAVLSELDAKAPMAVSG